MATAARATAKTTETAKTAETPAGTAKVPAEVLAEGPAGDLAAQPAAQDTAPCPACYPKGWPEDSTSTWCEHEGLRTRKPPPSKAG